MILVRKHILILVLLFTSVLLSQNLHYDYLYVTKPFSEYFSPNDYNAGADNWSIARDNRGIMYFGNSQGLLEFDGTSWRNIKVPFSAVVRAIAVDENGKIFITASSDFGYLEPDSLGQMQFVSMKKQLDKIRKINKEFWDVAVNSKGVFYKTPDEIIRWDGKDFKIWDSVYAYRLYKINNEIYSRNQGKGIMIIREDSIDVITDGDFFEDTGVFDMLQFQAEDQQAKILITTNYSGLFIYDGKKNIPFKTEIDDYLFNSQVYNACILNNGNIALATQRGGVAIITRKGKLVRFLNQNSGLPTNVSYDVYPDKLGGLWIATNEGIVFSETNSPLSLIPAKGQLRSQINSIARYDNNIYVANDIGVLMLEPGKINFELIQGSNKPAYHLLNFNNKLFAATNWGLKVIKGNEFITDLDPESINEFAPSSLFPDLFYFGGRGFLGIVKAEKNQQPIVKTVDLGTDENGYVVEDFDSTLWVMQYDKSILHITNKIKGFESSFGTDSIQIDDYSVTDGLPGNYWTIFSLNGRFLVSTDEGIFKFDHISKSFKPDSTLGPEFNTGDYFIHIIEESNTGGYWILAEVKGQYQLGKVLQQNDGKYKWETLPLFRRIDLDEVSSIYPDYDAHYNKEVLWISTGEGLVYFNPDEESYINYQYNTLIRKVEVNNDSFIYLGTRDKNLIRKKIELPYTKNNLSFIVSATTFDKPDATQYQFYLMGNDMDWSQWSNNSTKEYTNLSGGEYTIRVRAKNIYGIISIEDTFSFTILSPWYLTWWAYIFYLLAFGFGIFTVDRVQRRRLLRKEREHAETARKNREFEEARKLQLSMLPNDVPTLPNLDIAVYMKTATEVGGDYYDFHKIDETLTAVIGDATGHGLNAGMMVSITKGLFQILARVSDLKNVITQFNTSLISMKLQPMYMSMNILRIYDSKIEIIGAGMPPSLYYNLENNSVSEIESSGPPLGGFPNYNFEIFNQTLSKGDIVVLMSDGFIERMNNQKEIIGWDKGKELLSGVNGLSSEKIVEKFVNFSNEWGGGRPQDDDMTFVVVKVK